MIKLSVDESDSDVNSTNDHTTVETSKSKEWNEKNPQLNNFQEVWGNDSMQQSLVPTQTNKWEHIPICFISV